MALAHAAPGHTRGTTACGGFGRALALVADQMPRSIRSDTKAAGLAVGVTGEPKETVGLAFAKPAKASGAAAATVVSVVCKISAAGTATATFDGKTAACK